MAERQPYYQSIVGEIRQATQKQQLIEDMSGVTQINEVAYQSIPKRARATLRHLGFGDFLKDEITPKSIFRSETEASPDDILKLRDRLESMNSWISRNGVNIKNDSELADLLNTLQEGEELVMYRVRGIAVDAKIRDGVVDNMNFYAADLAEASVSFGSRVNGLFDVEIEFQKDESGRYPRSYETRGVITEMTPQECRLAISIMDEFSLRFITGDIEKKLLP